MFTNLQLQAQNLAEQLTQLQQQQKLLKAELFSVKQLNKEQDNLL